MQLLVGIVVGIVGMWLYRSEAARQRARQSLAAAPEPLQKAGQTVAGRASASAQRVAEVIDAAPLPARVKDAAARVTAATRQAGPGPTEYIGTPGVESAGGRDRTAPGGDLPADLAQP
ncbi:MAG: hypothetical protein M3336_13905 [Chloroflexota bacterium]|nr:hypothetical protein [Chloroflexota bacterium]